MQNPPFKLINPFDIYTHLWIRSSMQMFVFGVTDQQLFWGKNAQMHEKQQECANRYNPTVRWKITPWAWQINCRIKMLMGNKEKKNSYSSPSNRIKLTLLNVPPLSYCSEGVLVAAPQIMLPYLNWWEREHIIFSCPKVEPTPASAPWWSAWKPFTSV